MTSVRLALSRFHRDEAGSTAIEYALLISLIAVGIYASANSVGEALTILLTQVTDAFPS